MTARAATSVTLPRGAEPNSAVIWVILIGLFSPPVSIFLGGINVTPGRLVVILLFFPAVGSLFRSGRNRTVSDFFAVALAIWMLASSALNGGFRPYVGAEALEFLGAYFVGRAFIFGPSNLRAFVRRLGPITVVLVALALLDTLSGQAFTLNAFGIPNILTLRSGLVRASSVFEGSEHYGAFCVAAAAIFLYSERGVSRAVYVTITFFGTLLSLSSGPLMGLCLITSMFSYDRMLQRYQWRWKALLTVIGVSLGSILVFLDHPLEKIIVHFTFDPQTGFFRLGTWSAALPLIEQSPFLGYGLVRLGDSTESLIYLTSVDCVWLVEALRYGLPGVALLIMTMVSAFLKKGRSSAFDPSTYNVRTGFTLAIVAMGFIGLTVHFWDATWLFWNFCIGIRASIAEYEIRQLASVRRSVDLRSVNLALAPRHGVRR